MKENGAFLLYCLFILLCMINYFLVSHKNILHYFQLFDNILLLSYGGVGEVVNTLVCGTSMHEFDPHTPPQNGKKSNRLQDRNRFL